MAISSGVIFSCILKQNNFINKIQQELFLFEYNDRYHGEITYVSFVTKKYEIRYQLHSKGLIFGGYHTG